MKKAFALAAAFALAFSLAGCGGASSAGSGAASASASQAETGGEPVELTVFAAASLTETLNQIAEDYKTVAPNVTLTFNFDSSGTLKTQIQEGAVCDVFLSAGQKQMDQLDGASDQCEGENYVLEGTRKDILENKCALVVKEGSDIKSWDDFEAAIKAANSSDDLTFAMGNADVPVGQYTSKILTSLGLNEQDMVNKGIITYGTNVKAVTSAVSSGAADCGIIYATDAYSAEMTPVGYADPEMTGGPCIYPVAVMQNSKHQEEAKKFVDYLFSEEAMAFFTEVGFTEIEA